MFSPTPAVFRTNFKFDRRRSRQNRFDDTRASRPSGVLEFYQLLGEITPSPNICKRYVVFNRRRPRTKRYASNNVRTRRVFTTRGRIAILARIAAVPNVLAIFETTVAFRRKIPSNFLIKLSGCFIPQLHDRYRIFRRTLRSVIIINENCWHNCRNLIFRV